MIDTHELKKRDRYLKKLIAFQDTEPVKVVTGIRRCGKSSLLKLMAEHLKNSGISDDYGNPRTWRKYFKIESSLEWFNPLEDGGEIIDGWLTTEAFRRLTQEAPIINGSYVP